MQTKLKEIVFPFLLLCSFCEAEVLWVGWSLAENFELNLCCQIRSFSFLHCQKNHSVVCIYRGMHYKRSFGFLPKIQSLKTTCSLDDFFFF